MLLAVAAVVAAGAAVGLDHAGLNRPAEPVQAVPPEPTPDPPRRLPAEPSAVPGPLSPVPAELADVLALPVAPPSDLESDVARELLRQAVWLAARDGCGLRVRDAALGEEPPAGLPADRRVAVLRARGTQPVAPGWAVGVGPAGGEQVVWNEAADGRPRFALPFFRIQPAETLAAAEAASRDLFVRCLAAARFPAHPTPASAAPVPEGVEPLLAQARETAQFAAVRRLHAAVRDRGESPALVGALCRGYAHLAVLTEHHWSAAPAVYQARALLYGQRLLARDPAGPAGRWHRGYAAALAGLHQLALDDFAAAEALGGPAPEWAGPAVALARFDLGRLAAAPADAPLARLLHLLAVDLPGTPLATLRAARAVLDAEPECYRAHDLIAEAGGVSTLHEATLAAPQVFGEALAGRVREQFLVPPSAIAAADAGREAEVYAALRDAGGPATDRGEPSWAALAGLMQDVRFLLAWRRLYFLGEQLAVPTEEAARGFAPALAGHPLRPLVESFGFDPRADPGACRDRLLIPAADRLPVWAYGYRLRLGRFDPAAGKRLWDRNFYLNQTSYPQLVQAARHVAPGDSGRYTEGATVLSPRSAFRAALDARHGPPAVATPSRLAEWERGYAGFAGVQAAVGGRHLADGRPADGVRCLRRAAELSPDAAAYRELAATLRRQGDEAGWLETLEASLGQDDPGLDHAATRVAIATHFMGSKDFRRAEPYALAAAASFAGWALSCLADCEVGLGKWEEADDAFRAAADRYPEQALDWYFACRRQGKMDRAAAARAVRRLFDAYPDRTPAGHAFAAARFELLEGKWADARARFGRLQEQTPAALTAMVVALLADAAGDTVTRDRALGQAAEAPPTDDYQQVPRLAGRFRDWLAAGGTPDAAAVGEALAGPAAGPRADAAVFVGWFLANRGVRDRAAEQWRACLAAEAGSPWLKTHAQAFLEVAPVGR